MGKDITEILDTFKDHDHSVNAVRSVLSYCGKPGENRDVKREAINKLFTRTNYHGFTTLDVIESYEEY